MKLRDRIANFIHFDERAEFNGRWYTGKKCPPELCEKCGSKPDHEAVVQNLSENVNETGFLYMFLKLVRSNIRTKLPYGTRMVALIVDETGEEVRRFKETEASEDKFMNVLKFCSVKHVIVRVIFFKDSMKFRIPMTFDFR
ncbi:MAG: hypothetical protein K5668_11275 [Lachnospiraceae bacterium]|nr:hypothetical protein [Lachnospiraceae bacterium]